MIFVELRSSFPMIISNIVLNKNRYNLKFMNHCLFQRKSSEMKFRQTAKLGNLNTIGILTKKRNLLVVVTCFYMSELSFRKIHFRVVLLIMDVRWLF